MLLCGALLSAVSLLGCRVVGAAMDLAAAGLLDSGLLGCTAAWLGRRLRMLSLSLWFIGAFPFLGSSDALAFTL